MAQNLVKADMNSLAQAVAQRDAPGLHALTRRLAAEERRGRAVLRCQEMGKAAAEKVKDLKEDHAQQERFEKSNKKMGDEEMVAENEIDGSLMKFELLHEWPSGQMAHGIQSMIKRRRPQQLSSQVLSAARASETAALRSQEAVEAAKVDLEQQQKEMMQKREEAGRLLV